MGVPVYFSHIIKTHNNVIRKINSNPIRLDNFYLDCNSVIYDAMYKSNGDTSMIISSVVQSIRTLIMNLKPTYCVFIAFDGVAPRAKMDQQRIRRFKSAYQSILSKSILKEPADPWNSTMITPGTLFMKTLDESMKRAFSDPSEFNLQKIMVSGTDMYGEGEHKLFKYIRDFPQEHVDKNTVIYGLDADLIMLSMNHLPINPNIYLFRETPEFIKSIDSELEPNELYLMDIPELANAVIATMVTDPPVERHQCNRLMYDYILLCFFLGNDFMPHFPAINIRTGGIEKLMQAYKATIRENENLTDGNVIFWNNVRKLVGYLASREWEYFKQEHKLRDRREKNKLPSTTPEEQLNQFVHLPSYERSVEKYINPYKADWQTRYYSSLFSPGVDEEHICMQYLQGLEWTLKYYVTGCPDWRWCYEYHYPPLLQDLLKHIPCFNRELIQNKPDNPVTNLVQLCYVLPRQSLSFLPERIYKKILDTRLDQYAPDCDFSWAYCKYFWECHPNLPPIDIDELEQFLSHEL